MNNKKDQPTIDDFDLLEHTGHLLRRAQQIAVAAYADEVGRSLRPRQFSFLLAIYQQPGRRQVELTELIAMDRSTISEIAERLEKRGLLIRKPDEKDERAAQLYLTDSGKQAIQDALPGIIKVQENLLAKLPAHLQKPFIEALRTLTETAD